ncbi:MAG: GWxTD domain-containing protein [Longimicrobiales bacterium]
MEGGRPRGGPLFLVVLALAGACGVRGVGDPAARSSGPLSRPLETYEQLGFLAGPAHFPAVAGFSTMAGPGDSTWVLLGVSMPSSALRFQRSGAGFEAQYQVVATFLGDGETVKGFERDETVHVPTFAETGRTDESIVFQHAVVLPPGRYDVTLHASDANSTRGFRVRDTLDVPRYGANDVRFPQPLVVYEANGRSSREATPDLILNPRHTVAYGGAAPRVYLEAYGARDALRVVVTVVDEAGSAVWSDPALISAGDGGVGHAIIDLPASLPLGKLWVEVEPRDVEAGPRLRSPLVVSISDQWMVANFDDVLELVAYIATPNELDSLRAAGSPDDRRERWDAFWSRREPLAATPGNEFRDEFFRRVRYATEQFSQSGTPGWSTHRGEVFIVLGPPTSTEERQLVDRGVAARPNAIEWSYDSAAGGGLELLFVDRSGLGEYELTPSSLAAFRSVSERLKPRVGR